MGLESQQKKLLPSKALRSQFACLTVHVYYSVSAFNRGCENLPNWLSIKPKIHNWEFPILGSAKQISNTAEFSTASSWPCVHLEWLYLPTNGKLLKFPFLFYTLGFFLNFFPEVMIIYIYILPGSCGLHNNIAKVMNHSMTRRHGDILIISSASKGSRRFLSALGCSYPLGPCSYIDPSC